MPTKAQKITSKPEIKKSGSKIQSINLILSTLFYLIWVIVGLYLLLFVYAQIRAGSIQDFVKGPQSQAPTQQQAGAPTETTIPGIGKVNIQCVQSSLSTETIGKIVEEGSTKNLSAEEKSKLDACIVEKESAPASSN